MNEETEQVINGVEAENIDYKNLTIEILNMRNDEKFLKAVYTYVKKVNRILD